MKLNPEYLKPSLPPPTKISVFFVNKLTNSEGRKKFYSTNWSRCDTHETALHRIIKHKLTNVIIIDDTCNLTPETKIGSSKQFPNKDGVTFISREKDKLAYYIPDYSVAIKLLL